MLGLFSIDSIQFYGKQFLLGFFPAPCPTPPPGLLWRMLYVCRYTPQGTLLIWSIICYDPGTESVVCTLRFVEFCLSDCSSALNTLWGPGSMPNFTLSVGHSICYRETSGSLCCSVYVHPFWLSSNRFSHGLWANTLLTGWLKQINLLQSVSANSFSLFIEFTLFIPFYFQPSLETELGVSCEQLTTGLLLAPLHGLVFSLV